MLEWVLSVLLRQILDFIHYIGKQVKTYLFAVNVPKISHIENVNHNTHLSKQKRVSCGGCFCSLSTIQNDWIYYRNSKDSRIWLRTTFMAIHIEFMINPAIPLHISLSLVS